MRIATALVVLSLLLAGCASGGQPALASEPATETTDSTREDTPPSKSE